MTIFQREGSTIINIVTPGNYEEINQSLYEAMKFQTELGLKKIRIIFNGEGTYYSKGKNKTAKHVDVFLFKGSRTGELCYTTTGRTGYVLHRYLSWELISSIEIMSQAKILEERLQEFEKKLNKAKYPGVWEDLKPEDFGDSTLSFYDISKVFTRYEIEEIRKSFEEKNDFRFTTYGLKRDYSVSGKMTADGYKAWFSSEYSGCGNGQYYLLINPTTAVHYEND